MRIGERLYQLRKSRKLSQLQLGELSGLNSFTISKLELGVKSPNYHSIGLLSVALDVSLSEFMEGVVYDQNEY